MANHDDHECKFEITVPDLPTLEQLDALWRSGGRVALARAIAAGIRQDLENGSLVVRDGKVILADEIDELRAEEFGGIMQVPIATLQEVS